MFPRARVSVRPSLAPLIILLAILLLAGLLALSSWRNYQHEENLRQRFLTQQGATLIGSFEAGARTGMMMRWRADALETLVAETVRETEVAYIAILNEQGQVQAAGGSSPPAMSLPLAQALQTKDLLVRTAGDSQGRPVFEVSRRLQSRRERRVAMGELRGMGGMSGMGRMMPRHDQSPAAEEDSAAPTVSAQVIFVGLNTGEFRQARLDGLQQNLLLGGLLLLVGSAGFYLLFLAQRNRVTGATLETMELYTASLIEGMPAGLMSLDPQGQVLAVNAQTLEMLGRTREEVLGCSLAQVVEDEVLEHNLRERADFIEQPSVWTSADGTLLPLRVSASRLQNAEGEMLGTVLILRDMRELQAMEEQLERSRRHSALGVMATGVAHEIRNPLGTLRGFAQYFQRSSPDPQAKEYAGLMISEVDRLNRVISALLQFARPREAEPGPVVIARLCERVAALMASEAEGHGVELQIDSACAPEQFEGDFDLLLQMLLNLLQNAVEACGAGGLIRLQFKREDALLEIRVSDNGRGIDAAARSAIFDPFYTTRKNGTGLGLAIVSQVVAQHGGEISVASQPGQGTEFIVRLPIRGQG